MKIIKLTLKKIKTQSILGCLYNYDLFSYGSSTSKTDQMKNG